MAHMGLVLVSCMVGLHSVLLTEAVNFPEDSADRNSITLKNDTSVTDPAFPLTPSFQEGQNQPQKLTGPHLESTKRGLFSSLLKKGKSKGSSLLQKQSRSKGNKGRKYRFFSRSEKKSRDGGWSRLSSGGRSEASSVGSSELSSGGSSRLSSGRRSESSSGRRPGSSSLSNKMKAIKDKIKSKFSSSRSKGNKRRHAAKIYRRDKSKNDNDNFEDGADGDDTIDAEDDDDADVYYDDFSESHYVDEDERAPLLREKRSLQDQQDQQQNSLIPNSKAENKNSFSKVVSFYNKKLPGNKVEKGSTGFHMKGKRVRLSDHLKVGQKLPHNDYRSNERPESEKQSNSEGNEPSLDSGKLVSKKAISYGKTNDGDFDYEGADDISNNDIQQAGNEGYVDYVENNQYGEREEYLDYGDQNGIEEADSNNLETDDNAIMSENGNDSRSTVVDSDVLETDQGHSDNTGPKKKVEKESKSKKFKLRNKSKIKSKMNKLKEKIKKSKSMIRKNKKSKMSSKNKNKLKSLKSKLKKYKLEMKKIAKGKSKKNKKGILRGNSKSKKRKSQRTLQKKEYEPTKDITTPLEETSERQMQPRFFGKLTSHLGKLFSSIKSKFSGSKKKTSQRSSSPKKTRYGRPRYAASRHSDNDEESSFENDFSSDDYDDSERFSDKRNYNQEIYSQVKGRMHYDVDPSIDNEDSLVEREYSYEDDPDYSIEVREYQNELKGKFPAESSQEYPLEEREYTDGGYQGGDTREDSVGDREYNDADYREFSAEERRYPQDENIVEEGRYMGGDDRKYPFEGKREYVVGKRKYSDEDERGYLADDGERPNGMGMGYIPVDDYHDENKKEYSTADDYDNEGDYSVADEDGIPFKGRYPAEEDTYLREGRGKYFVDDNNQNFHASELEDLVGDNAYIDDRYYPDDKKAQYIDALRGLEEEEDFIDAS